MEQKKSLESEKDAAVRLEKDNLSSVYRYKLKQLDDELKHHRDEKQGLDNKIKQVKDVSWFLCFSPDTEDIISLQLIHF